MRRRARPRDGTWYYYDMHADLRAHLQLFVNAHNSARLKTLRGLTPYEFICGA